MKKILEGFKNPDRKYAIYQIIHGKVKDQTLVDIYDKRWFAGVVGNIDYYMPDCMHNKSVWQDAAHGIRSYINRGMHAWLYDEKGYPSGTAGGYVTESNPEYIAKGLYCYDYWKKIIGPIPYRSDIPGDELWRAVLIPADGAHDPIDVTDCLNENNVLHIDVPEGTFYLFMMCKRRLFDGTHATESYSEPRNYISLSDKEATKAFIECTHEQYKKYLSDEFGNGILAMFTDEPSLISWNIRNGVFPILPWLESYPEDFLKKYGYDFMLACVAVVMHMGEDVIKRRCDFWEFIADTVADGYFKTIREWCHENNLKSSGHMLEEERLQAHIYNYGSFFRSMQQMDWPGIDQLHTEPKELMNFANIPIARFISSFADLNGEHEVFTEFSDHSVRMRGEIAPIDCYYHSLNWHLAMGVNQFTSYYSWNQISDEQAYAINHYAARGGYLLRQGVRDSRIAIFYPEAAMWAAYTPSTAERAVDHSEHMLALERAFTTVSWDLLRAQTDFDYIDQKILTEGEIRDGMLCYRDRTYSALVLPGVDVLEDAAAEKLLIAVRAGVLVFFCDQVPQISRETGEKSAFYEEFKKQIASGAIFFAHTDAFSDLLEQALPDSCRSVRLSGDCTMLLSHCRTTSDGKKILFITNMGDAVYNGEMTVIGNFQNVCTASLTDGEINPVCTSHSERGITIPILLASGEGKFFILD